ncbi:hypothetical protein LTR37_011023 [Vermiconidia calcicola]|uniref:Uncharacterized protein n=1 Tax=Vermiconidia calcicola TaxID=1690605 RepID=A0ACC3N3E2_9PEZI|nr:hypothetical protein LTR37_011023 [Vermiconidia calcicola]
MYGSFLWFQNPCGCATCLKLRESFASAYHAVQNAHQAAPSYKSVVAAASAIGEAAEKVHREHCPELYIGHADLSLANRNGVENSQSPTRSATSSDKFLVCDHCMAHGLICNEAAVCEQCRNYSQPCIHRWCATSPTSKEDCSNVKCHYAHMDSIPHSEKEPKWIIFKGDLPHHLSRGKLPSLGFSKLEAHIDFDEWMKLLNVRQEHAVGIFYKDVAMKGATYEGHYIQCLCSPK